MASALSSSTSPPNATSPSAPQEQPSGGQSRGRLSALLLALLLLLACLLSDWLVPNSVLSLPLLVAAAIAAATTAWGEPRLRRLKIGQVIRQEGPQAHLSKAGTPTMGGLLVVPVGVLVGGLTSPEDPRLLAVGALSLAFMAIGATDDWRSLTKRRNTGLGPRA